MNDSVPGKQNVEQDEKTINTMECFEHDEEIAKAMEGVKCEPCQEDGKSLPVVGFCVDCQNYLCDSCYSCHCVPKPTKTHKLLNMEEMPRRKVSADLSEICKKHEGEPIRYYCKAHDSIGCNSCMLLEHKPCELCILSEKAKDVETSELFRVLCGSLSHIEVESETQLGLASKNSEASRDFYHVALEKIEDLRKALNAHLDTLKEHVEKEAAVRKDKDTTNMEHLVDKIKAVQVEQRKIKEDLQILQETGQNKQLFIALMKSKREVENMLRELSEISRSNNVTRYAFQEGRGIRAILEGISTVGHLVDVNDDETKRSVQDPSLTEYAEFGIVKNVRLSMNYTVSIDSTEKQVQIFQNKSVSATSFLKSNPWDLCSLGEFCFAVTLPLQRKIKRFLYNKYRQSLDEAPDIQLDSQCEGIDFGDEMLFVACTDPVQVLILSLEGDILRKFTNENTGTALFQQPAYIQYTPSSRCIYVTDRATEEVLMLSLDENLKLMYQTYKRKKRLIMKVFKRNENKIHLWTIQSVYNVSSLKSF